MRQTNRMTSRINESYTIDIPEGLFIVDVSICSYYERGDYFDEDLESTTFTITDMWECDQDGKLASINKNHLHYGELYGAVELRVRQEEVDYTN